MFTPRLRARLFTLIFALFVARGASADPSLSQRFSQDIAQSLSLPSTDFDLSARIQREGPNSPGPEFGAQVKALKAYLRSPRLKARTQGSLALEAYRIQTLTHLRHVSMSFVRDPKSEEYVHADVLKGPFPFRPTMHALQKTADFLRVLEDESVEALPYDAINEDAEKALLAEQQKIVASIIDGPLEAYVEYSERIRKHGQNAPWAEYRSNVEYLLLRLNSGEDVQRFCSENPQFEWLRKVVVEKLVQMRAKKYPYLESIFAMERAIEFFDIVARTLDPEHANPLYHSERYEYYIHFLTASAPDHIFWPTTSNLGSTNLIQVRSAPIGFAGLVTRNKYVDGFWQTPYEFLMHDVNHVRRMFQFLVETAEKLGLSVSAFSARSNRFIRTKLLKEITFDPSDPAQLKEMRKLAKMILFEILHEDALAAEEETVRKGLLRPPGLITPFERIDVSEDGEETAVYFMEPGATTLAYVFRKLKHTFYDRPDERKKYIVAEELRNRRAIVDAALELYRALGPLDMEEQELVGLLEEYVSTDEGFPQAFLDEIVADINQRRAELGNDFAFKLLLPKDADDVVKDVLEHAQAAGKKVHSLFGYAALGYQDEAAMLEDVRQELATLDPKSTIINIGATHEGINAAYKVAKEMGFETMGVVSTKSLARGGEFSPWCDSIFLVKDRFWGGYLPGQSRVTPTTDVYLRVSQSITARGGGYITGVTLYEGQKRGLAVSFRPFDMNHDLARENALENGEMPPVDFSGPAAAVWKKLSDCEKGLVGSA